MLGRQGFPRLHFSRLNLPEVDLGVLCVVLSLNSEEEIWSVVRDLPSEKAPGHDGFTGWVVL